MIYAKFRLMAFDGVVERVYRQIGLAVAAKPVAPALLPPLVAGRHLAHAEYLSVEAKHHFRIQSVVGDVPDPGELLFFFSRHAELPRRQANRKTFGVVNSDLAVMNIVGLLEDHAARIQS